MEVSFSIHCSKETMINAIAAQEYMEVHLAIKFTLQEIFIHLRSYDKFEVLLTLGIIYLVFWHIFIHLGV